MRRRSVYVAVAAVALTTGAAVAFIAGAGILAIVLIVLAGPAIFVALLDTWEWLQERELPGYGPDDDDDRTG